MNVFIRPDNQELEWFMVTPDGESQHYAGSIELLANFYQEHVANGIQWILIVPTVSTAQADITFTDKERKHILKAIPFLLEDDLLTEANHLHIVMDKPATQHVSVVAIDKALLTQWLEQLSAIGIKPAYCLPESKLLLLEEANWHIYYRHNTFILSENGNNVFGFDELHFSVAIELLTKNYTEFPEKIILFADDQASIEQAWQYIPNELHERIDAKILPYSVMLESQYASQIKIWNMLKGSFAYGQQWMASIRPWKWVGICLLVVMLVKSSLLMVEYRQLLLKNTANNKEIETLFRSVIPKGQIVNPQKQLQHELDVIQQGGATGFMQKLEIIGKVLSSHQIQAMNSLNYEKDKNEIRLDVIVPDYEQLQTIINELQQQGLNSDIQNSNAQDSQLRVRIKISG